MPTGCLQSTHSEKSSLLWFYMSKYAMALTFENACRRGGVEQGGVSRGAAGTDIERVLLR